MTSPRVTTIEVVSANPSVTDEVATNLHLTAIREDALDAPVSQTKPEMEEQEMSEEQLERHGSPEQVQKEAYPSSENAVVTKPALMGNGAIGEDAQERPLNHLTDEVDQMAATNALLAYAQPPGLYNYATSALSNHEGLPSLPMDPSTGQRPYLDSSPYARNDETRISAYAKLEFDDGEFYMNTYSVILGRDLAAARDAMRREAEEQRRKSEEEGAGVEPKTPVKVKKEESRYSKSVVSESGGILREGDESNSESRKRKGRRASKKSKSTGSSSQHHSRRNSLIAPPGFSTYQPQSITRLAAPVTDGAVPLDPASLRPSPHDCPLIGIHPPGTTAASGYKAISRQHVKIAYNPKKNLFEAHIIGRNGAFVDEEFCYHNNVIPLKSGSRLQIGGVVVRFMLPDVAIGETGAEQREEFDETDYSQRYSEGGKEMSFDFGETPREGMHSETSEEVSDEERQDSRINMTGEDEDEDEEGQEEEEGNMEEDNEQEEEIVEDPAPQPPKRRGPGRPPKNGIMSKREQRLLEKEAQQREKDRAAQKTGPQGPSNGKNKVGRPRKHPLPPEEPKREKRKYTKRKPKEPKDSDTKEEGSGTDDKKDKKDKKRPRAPRSPTPTFNEADLTPEQLAKPQANYVSLIYDALSNSSTGQMSLPQIYRAIQRKYPFFVLKCNTNGWQSSVRHNLSQNNAFRKVERDGKGWMWAIVEGVSIEKEKKRRPTPPPHLPPGHHQAIYTGHPQMVPPGYPPGMMAPPPGYQYNMPMQPPYPPGHPPTYMGPPPQTNGHPPPQSSMPGQLQPPFPPHLHAPVAPLQGPGPNGSGVTTYSSPYAPKPTTSTSPPPGQTQATPPVQSPAISQPLQAPQALQARPSPQTPEVSQRSQTAEVHISEEPAAKPAPPPFTPAAQPLSQQGNEIKNAIDAYKLRMTDALRGAVVDSETIVNSAINRFFNIPMHNVTLRDEQAEKAVVDGLKSVLNQLGVKTDSYAQTNPIQNQANNHQQAAQPAQSQPQNYEHGHPSQQARPMSQGADKIMRPSFSAAQAQNRASPSIPRPSMATSGMKRSESNGSVHATASASPAPTTPGIPNAPLVSVTAGNNSTGEGEGSRATLPGKENAVKVAEAAVADALAGEKRERSQSAESESEEERAAKRLSTAMGPMPVKT